MERIEDVHSEEAARPKIGPALACRAGERGVHVDGGVEGEPQGAPNGHRTRSYEEREHEFGGEGMQEGLEGWSGVYRHLVHQCMGRSSVWRPLMWSVIQG